MNLTRFFFLFFGLQYFETLAKRASVNGHAVDIFACAYDQPGFSEMQDLPKRTGGLVVLAGSRSLHVLLFLRMVD